MLADNKDESATYCCNSIGGNREPFVMVEDVQSPSAPTTHARSFTETRSTEIEGILFS
jgi:hypothetical protein